MGDRVPQIGPSIPSPHPWQATASPVVPPPTSVPLSLLPADNPVPRPHSAPHPQSTQPSQRDATVAELRNRKLLLQKAIAQIDASVVQLMAARSGIPSAIWLPKMQEVYTEVKSRKDLLSKVNQAIAQASGQPLAHADGASSVPGSDNATEPAMYPEARAGPVPPAQNTVLPGSECNVPQVRRASSQPELSPTPEQPRKMYTVSDLMERRTVLQESIISWTNAATQLDAARTATPDPSWDAKYQQTQFEIKRREELMVKLNHAIAQMSAQPRPEDRLVAQVPPPLDKPRFDMAYSNYCRGKSIEMNTKIIMPDARIPVIDLYQLHVAVMKEGSFAKV
ncbi:hypothetical protein BV22DRAFT_219818 [Leucogyrophana mollusca]|uniref:Uncharacterized protein n=1 Tax=Leucogyrophana mollusca TaxID=85980 RepID=A0ACB8BS68_9AGAM|nr:hypothetical protein BV22DRAFT_219818 [Leucogyrophana mollusca]